MFFDTHTHLGSRQFDSDLPAVLERARAAGITRMVAPATDLENARKLLAITEHIRLDPEDEITNREVRFRTVGDATCTAAVESPATTVDDIIQEIIETKISERGATRLDDRMSEAAMEDRKKNGYF